MPSGLQTSAFTIGEILSGPFLLNVPIYQRPYSWGQEHAAQLLDDLQEAAGIDGGEPRDPYYFLGYFLLMDASGVNSARLGIKMAPREFDIVDGQQRLVTLLTMFAIIRDLETNPNSPMARRISGLVTALLGTRFFRRERYRIHVATRERATFEKYVLAPGGTQLAVPDTELEGTAASLLAMREHYVSVLSVLTPAERALIFDYVTQKCEAVIILSHDIDRAHRMFIVLNERGKRLARNDILKADVISRLPAAELEWGNAQWDAASARLGEDFETFFAHLRTIYAYNRPQIVSGVRAVMQEEGGASPFLRKAFLPLADTYAVMRSSGSYKGSDLTPVMRKHLAYLNRLADGDWAPAALLALKDRQSYPERTERMLAEIDRVAHLMRLLCLGTGKRKRRFALLTAALREGKVLDSTHPAFTISRDEIRNIAYHLKDIHKRNPKMCKLLLFRLNDELSGEMTFADSEDYTVEHVLPQRVPKTSEWNGLFVAGDERARWTESLGNLVLITPKQNEKARNALFAEKKQIYSTPDGNKPLLPITKQVLKVEQWLPEEVQSREDLMMDVIRRIWRIDLPASKSLVIREAS